MSPSTSSFCSRCSKTKAHKLPFQSFTILATMPFQVIHTNLWGPSPVTSHASNRFYVHFTDEFSRFSWFYICAHEFDVSKIFSSFKQYVENLLLATIKTVQCDNGIEFKPLIAQYLTIHFNFPIYIYQNKMAWRRENTYPLYNLASLQCLGLLFPCSFGIRYLVVQCLLSIVYFFLLSV
jgi:hypothetical protein